MNPHDEVNIVRNRTFEQIAIGDSASIQRTLSADDIALFAVMSGDDNPQHLDAEFGASSRYQGVIAHGMWGAALISAVLGTRLPGAGTVYTGQTLRFLLPVRVGDTLDIGVTVTGREASTRKVTLACRCVNQHGEIVLDGVAEVIAPSEQIERTRATLPEVRLHNGDGTRRLVEQARSKGPIKVAVIHPCDELSLAGALDAHAAGLITPILVAPRARLEAVALANLTLSSERKWYGLSASFSIRNLFDRRYEVVSPFDWRPASDIPQDTLRMDGRTYWFQLRYDF